MKPDPLAAPGGAVTVIVPTFNEGPNIAELVRRLASLPATAPLDVLFVDDSTDDTPQIIEAVAATAPIQVSLLHREDGVGGLSGAVVEGLRRAKAQGAKWAVVMDGDLQHPPELVPTLLETGDEQGLDVVVASRYTGAGDAGGLDGPLRKLVSRASGVLARSMFPVRLRGVSDPMTGFFAVRTDAVDLDQLQPMGFKILLEILARQSLRVGQIPFIFGERFGGESKATFANGMNYLKQLVNLRFGRLSPFALIGLVGTAANLAILAGLQATGMWYLAAVIIANIVTIITNFLLQERFVFHDLRDGSSAWRRFAESFTFNGVEALVRTVLLWLIVQYAIAAPLLIQAVLILIAFVVRFVFHARVVYRQRA
ncbi:MAG: glycosyltransferase [Promicromonosporaceae bacterium]|nr:glycosyltransferase [Promicromonosporaceae bacterium]